MDWIHCNQCFNQPKNSSPGYLLTSCGHIFCETCESIENIDRCKTCKSSCTVIKLTANMKPEVRRYFEDIEDAAKKMFQTIRFQKNHRFSLFKTFKKIDDKYTSAKNHIRKLEAEISSLKKELEQKKSRIVRSSRTPEFNFIPRVNRKNSFFNGICSQNPPQHGTTNSPFRLPDIHAYQRFRNGIQPTRNLISPAESTPRNYLANINQKKNLPLPRAQSKFSLRTPPRNDFH